MREPDRIARQAGILPSVIIRHIPQLEDFHFLVRGVKAGGLEETTSRPNKRPKRGGVGGEGKGTMSEGFWKEKKDGGAFSSAIQRHLPRKGSTESPPRREEGRVRVC